MNVNPLKEGSEKPLEDANPLSGQAELEIKNSTHTLEGEEAEPKTQLNSGNVSLKRKGRYNSGVAVRRSARLQDVVPVHNQEIERLIEEVAISDDSEKEEEPPANEETETNPTDSNMEDVNLGERIDYLFRLLNEQQKTIEILKSLVFMIATFEITSDYFSYSVFYINLTFICWNGCRLLRDLTHMRFQVLLRTDIKVCM